MQMKRQILAVAALITAVFAPVIHGQPSANVTIFAVGLDGPRGLEFGPDGNLYVAEAGSGGGTSTVGLCEQVPPPVGPALGGKTARISKITPQGIRTTVVDGLPSRVSSLSPPDFLGVADVAFYHGALYAVLSGGGCSHGNPDIPNGVIRVDINSGAWEMVTDLSAFFAANPAANPEPGDFEPDGVPYSMISAFGQLYIAESNQGRLLKVNPAGQVRQAADISATQGHVVPTALATDGKQLFVGTLSLFPIIPGSAAVLTANVSGKFTSYTAGFTTIVGLAFDSANRLYVLELSSAPGFPTPGAGKVVRWNADGSVEDIATGLVVPTGMTYGPDGALYVSNFGAGPPGTGQIVRITIP
jgi:sugar lactone lactonase YvrE